MSAPAAPTELSHALTLVRPYLVRAAWFGAIGALLMLAPTGYMLEVYDRVINSRNLSTLAMLTALVVFAYAVTELLEWARSDQLAWAGIHFEKALQGRVFRAVFDANLRRQPGGTTQPMADLRTLRDFFSSPGLAAALESPIALVFLALVFAISPLLGWSALVGALVQTGLAWLTQRRTQPPLLEANRHAVAAQTYADTFLRMAEVIESMGMLPDIQARWMGLQRRTLALQARASLASGGLQAGSKFVQQVLGSALLGLGAWLLLRDALNGGSVMMIVGSTLGGRVLAPLVLVVAHWRTLVSARESWGRLDQFLQQTPVPPKRMPLPAPKGELVVENLMAVAPGTGVGLLRAVQFALKPGEVLAVVGASGTGKTTLARLLIGLWPTAAGKVRLNGADIHAWDKDELGPHVGYLPQNVGLIDGTVADNIARFGRVDLEKVHAAAAAVGLHEFILSLPDGYDSPVGRDGTLLSGGQRQRVALARALYGQPVFVVLDEPNSNLDDQGDEALAQAIRALKARGTTFVVMTHRTSVLEVSDKMLVLAEGAQRLFGPRDEVWAELNKSAAPRGAPPPTTGSPGPGRPPGGPGPQPGPTSGPTPGPNPRPMPGPMPSSKPGPMPPGSYPGPSPGPQPFGAAGRAPTPQAATPAFTAPSVAPPRPEAPPVPPLPRAAFQDTLQPGFQASARARSFSLSVPGAAPASTFGPILAEPVTIEVKATPVSAPTRSAANAVLEVAAREVSPSPGTPETTFVVTESPKRRKRSPWPLQASEFGVDEDIEPDDRVAERFLPTASPDGF